MKWLDGITNAMNMNLGKLQEMQAPRIQSLDLEDPLEGGHGNPLQYSCLENPMLFTSDDQNIGASASASVLPMSVQG